MSGENKVLGFLGKIGLVDVHDDEAAKPKAPAPPPIRNTPLPPAPPASTASVPLGAIDPAVLERLEHRLQTACPPAYTAFMEQYEALSGVIHDDATRGHAAMKTSHTTVEQLTASLDQMLGVMQTAKDEFQRNYDENRARHEKESASLEAEDALAIADHERQIGELQAKLTTLCQKRDQDKIAAHEQAQAIEGVRVRFDLTHASVMTRLVAQKNRVAAMPKV